MASIPRRWPGKQISSVLKSDEQVLTHLSGNELEVSGALSITVTGTKLGTSLVGWVLGKTTIGVHLDKVQGTVDAAAWGR